MNDAGLAHLAPHKFAYGTDQGTILLIHAQPRASFTEFAGQYGDVLKVRLAAPPSEGAANDELRRFLAERFRLPLSKVQLLSGGGSRRKRMLLKGVSLDQVRNVLDVAVSPKT